MDFPFRIERTQNRTSSASFQGGRVVIRLAGRLSSTEEERHIQTLLRRMAKRHSAHLATKVIDPLGTLLEATGASTVTLGDGTTRTFSIVTDTRTSARRAEKDWTIRRRSGTTDAIFRKSLWRHVGIVEQPRMEALVHSVNARTFGARVTSVKLRHMRSRFGSCAPKGRITLNTALLFVPETLLTYVIIHELAHILHPNHSRAFWAAVESVLPTYEACRKELRTYRLRGG